jgi:tropomodulin
LLPPSQRCKDQTNKSATGPLNRKKLLEFLTKFAQEQEDWPELKQFQPGVKKGKIWVPKETDKNSTNLDEKIILDLDDGTSEALDDASEADLIDLAGILGLHSMLNQDQFHNSILNKGQKIGDKFESIVKATVPKKLPFEPDNMTDPVKTAEQVERNDPELKELNLNNVKYIPRETFKKLFNGLKTNTNLQTLSLSNTGLTDGPAEKLVEALKENTTLRTVNLESNYLSGPMLRELIRSLLAKQKVLEFRAANQRPQIMGNRIEMDIAKAVMENKSLLRLGMSFDVPDARMKVTDHLQQNNDNVRLKRIGSFDG